MSAKWFIVQFVVLFSVKSHGLPDVSIPSSGANNLNPASSVLQTKFDAGTGRMMSPVAMLSKAASDVIEKNADPDWAMSEETFEGRKRRYKKHELLMLLRMLMGLKVALLGVVLPFGVIAAKVLSWKAVTLSLLAFMLAKIVFVKNLFLTKTPPSNQSPQPPVAPIIITAPSNSPSHDVWKRQSQQPRHPTIHLQPEVHVHQAEPTHHSGAPPAEHPSNPTWTWAEEGRQAADPHVMAFGAWRKKTV